MINRINLILRAKNITARQFAEEIGIQPSGMSHIMGGRNNPSLDFVTKVIRRYPEIDANWLLLGKGEMYASENGRMREDVGTRKVESGDEATLFSVVDEPEPEPQPLPMHQVPESDNVSVEEKENTIPAPENEAIAVEPKPAPIVADGRRLVKILFFYDDHTFAEYRPE